MDNLKRVTLAKETDDPYYLKDPKLLELYKKCLPPKEAYYYFPKGDEIIIHNQKKPNKSFRRIYYNVPYTEQEKKWIEEFKQLVKSHPETQIPDFFGDYLILAFIYSTSCNMEESYKKVVDYFKFSRETFPVPLNPNSKLVEILNKGFVYVYGRDNRFRPIIVCQCKIFQKYYKDYQTEEILRAVYFLCQFLVNNMLIPGQMESWVFIINISGVSIVSMPEPIKKMVPALSNFFCARLYKNYIMGLNFISRIIFKLVCSFLDEVTVSKINILDKKNDPKLFESIRRDNIEMQFGGTAPNLPAEPENGYFPPRMPSDKFLKDEENPQNLLMSEDEYITKYKNGEIPEECVSPYIYEKIKKEEEINKKNENLEETQEIVVPPSIINSEPKTSQIKIEKPIISTEQKIKKQNEQNKNDNLLIQKRVEKERIKRFVNNNWNFSDELNFPQYHPNSSNSLNQGNILNDIYKFGRKKQNFISNISLLNKSRFSIISNY